MKNIQGTEENLGLFNQEGIKVYEYYKNSSGFRYECTRDSNGNELTYKDSDGFSYEYTYNSNNNILTYKNSNGNGCEYTYDSEGNELTYKDSTGVRRGFDIPEYTMEELIEKLGNFKIKK